MVGGTVYREYQSETCTLLVHGYRGELYHEVSINLAFNRASGLILHIEL